MWISVKELCPIIRQLVKKMARMTPVILVGRKATGFRCIYSAVLPMAVLTIGIKGRTNRTTLTRLVAQAHCRKMWRLCRTSKTVMNIMIVTVHYASRSHMLGAGGALLACLVCRVVVILRWQTTTRFRTASRAVVGSTSGLVQGVC